MHISFFRGIDDAEQVRDLMLERLRRIKDSGLGDVDDAKAVPTPRRASSHALGTPESVEALRALLGEARALREAAERLEVDYDACAASAK